jgi:hypothetical protein
LFSINKLNQEAERPTMGIDKSMLPPTHGVIDSLACFATKLTVIGAACCIVLVVVTEGASLLAIWNLILPLTILLGFRAWTLMSSSFRPAGVLALAFSIVAILTVVVPHIGITPRDLKLEGGNHLVALFMFLPIAATIYGGTALLIVFVLRFVFGWIRAMNSTRL